MCAWQRRKLWMKTRKALTLWRDKSSVNTIAKASRLLLVHRVTTWYRTEDKIYQNKSLIPTKMRESARLSGNGAPTKALKAFQWRRQLVTAQARTGQQHRCRRFTFWLRRKVRSHPTQFHSLLIIRRDWKEKKLEKWGLIREIYVSDETYFVIKSEFRTQNTRLFELHTTENKCTVLRKWKNLVKNRVHETRRLKQG